MIFSGLFLRIGSNRWKIRRSIDLALKEVRIARREFSKHVHTPKDKNESARPKPEVHMNSIIKALVELQHASKEITELNAEAAKRIKEKGKKPERLKNSLRLEEYVSNSFRVLQNIKSKSVSGNDIRPALASIDSWLRKARYLI